MMVAFGRFLEVAVPARDVLRSLAFYRALGFAELVTGDVRAWHYAVVTDGTIAIGLHGAGVEEPALAFVRPNLARQVLALQQAGHAFDFSRLGAEEFNEAALRSPDGHVILMMEARTWSPGATEPGATTVIGRCAEVTLACTDPAAARGFFETAGFLPADVDDPPDVVRLDAPGLRLGLRRGPVSAAATLRFAAGDPQRALRELAARDLHPARRPEGQVLVAPEGTRLVIGDASPRS
jgi:catechol 2,3-dioxygenase-like lactoylglutathione lyase family enzyme